MSYMSCVRLFFLSCLAAAVFVLLSMGLRLKVSCDSFKHRVCEDPVTHWPCFFTGSQCSSLESYCRQKLQSEHSLTPSPANTPLSVLRLCVLHFRHSACQRCVACTCSYIVRVHPRWCMHEYLLFSSVLISSQYMNTPKTSSSRYLPPSPFGPCHAHTHTHTFTHAFCVRRPLVGACIAP